MERKTIEELIPLIQQWGKDKGITDPYKQSMKAMEEFGELNAAILRDNSLNEIDSFGDLLTTIIILADIRGISLRHALEVSWNEIKGRSGQTVNGTFIKSSDIY